MRILLLGVLISLLSIGSAFAGQLEGVDAFPLESLKPGLKGTGYTVIRGTQIQTFQVEILELIPKGGFDGGPMILAKFTGEVVDFSKGIAAGYSGSPVYINDKLLGAVSMAIPFTDTHVGGITPIGSMLAALPDQQETDFSTNTVLPPSTNAGKVIDEDGNFVDATGQAIPEPVEDVPAAEQPVTPEDTAPAGEQATRISYVHDAAAALAYNERSRAAGHLDFQGVTATTPILTSGLSPDVLERFGTEVAEKLGPNFELIRKPMGTAEGLGLLLKDSSAQTPSQTAPGLFYANKATAPPLQPGDAVTVSLMQGDIEMNAIGTVTYSDPKGRVLIFGHPMLGTGETNMPIGKGYVTWTHTSIERPFKEGVRLNTLGTLTEDRGAACGGTFAEQPDLVPVRVKIKDVDLGSEQSLRFDVIRHPDYTPILVAMGLAQASQQVLDRQLGGTMKLSYHIEGVGLKEPLRRTNFYSDDANVVFNGALEIVPISNLLQTNIYRDVKITKMEIMVEITRNRVNASIDNAEIVWDKKKDDAKSEDGLQTPESAPASENEPDNTKVRQVSQGWLPIRNWVELRREATYEVQAGEPAPADPTTQQTLGNPASGLGIPPNQADLPTFAPGETIRVRVRLQPYHTDPVFREFSIRVPEDFPSGNTMLMVHGGGDLISASELNGKGRSLFGMGPIIDVKEHDLDSVLDQIVQWPLNNELLITLLRPYDPSAPQELGGTGEMEKTEQKIDAKYQMEWVIYNGFMLPVSIVSKTDQQADQLSQQLSAGADDARDGDDDEDRPMSLDEQRWPGRNRDQD